jgi:fumarate reductase subunit D
MKRWLLALGVVVMLVGSLMLLAGMILDSFLESVLGVPFMEQGTLFILIGAVIYTFGTVHRIQKELKEGK